MTLRIKKFLKKTILSFVEKNYQYNRITVSKVLFKTLKIIKKEIKFIKIYKIKSSIKVCHWKILKEWKVKYTKILDLKNIGYITY